ESRRGWKLSGLHENYTAAGISTADDRCYIELCPCTRRIRSDFNDCRKYTRTHTDIADCYIRGASVRQYAARLALGHYNNCDLIYNAAVCENEISRLNIERAKPGSVEPGFSCFRRLDSFMDLMMDSEFQPIPS